MVTATCKENPENTLATSGRSPNVTCSAIWGLLDKHDDLRTSHELLNTERIV